MVHFLIIDFPQIFVVVIITSSILNVCVNAVYIVCVCRACVRASVHVYMYVICVLCACVLACVCECVYTCITCINFLY